LIEFFHQLFANLHAVSTTDLCLEQSILNYKSTELIENILTTSGTSPDSSARIHTTFSLLQTGATVPLNLRF
jgi:hypothetical protein